MRAKQSKTKRHNQAAADVDIKESFYVEEFQLLVRNRKKTNHSELLMNMHGRPEYPNPPYNQRANYAEIEFIPDGQPLADPSWTPNVCGSHDNRIRISFHESQFSTVTEMLRNSAGVRCFYTESGGVKEAGISDWNEISKHVKRSHSHSMENARKRLERSA
jgi:hypothetical protein